MGASIRKIFPVLLSALVISAGVWYLRATPTGEPLVSGEVICAEPVVVSADRSEPVGMVWIERGSFTMGGVGHHRDEGPPHEVTVSGFWIDRYEVTNAQFAQFVADTDYVTVAERVPDPLRHPELPVEFLVPGSVVFVPPTDLQSGGSLANWWQFVADADWRHPYGSGSTIMGLDNHPVVHIAYEDAVAYAQWLGRSLPTEAQWEYAARGGLQGATYAWGEKLKPNDTWQANTWQGLFPIRNTNEDGYVGAAPVGCFAANGYGLHDMSGNVWEWTKNWYQPGHRDEQSEDPVGPMRSFDPRQPNASVRVIKGGSYLCAPNYCLRYRPAARHAQEPDLPAGHIGFRTVLNKS